MRLEISGKITDKTDRSNTRSIFIRTNELLKWFDPGQHAIPTKLFFSFLDGIINMQNSSSYLLLMPFSNGILMHDNVNYLRNIAFTYLESGSDKFAELGRVS